MKELFPIQLDGPEAMQSLGSELSKYLTSGDIIALIGDMGAGKTELTRGIVKGLGREDCVTSPTFAIVNEYRDCEPALIHFDWFRMKSSEELLAIGWEDYMEQDAILVVEWADLFPEMIPAGSHCIEIKHKNSIRELDYAIA